MLFCICAGIFIVLAGIGSRTDVWVQGVGTVAWLSAIVLPVIFLLTKIYFAIAYRQPGPPADPK